MRYELEFRPKAVRDLKRLSPDISQRIERKLELLRDDMTGDVKRLVNFAPGWRLRVGDWRVLFQPKEARLVVHRIVHRSEAYD
jgi:mRNA interferase RelE/StbE